jgi:uncharacterized protein YecT (DUF1311 family)
MGANKPRVTPLLPPTARLPFRRVTERAMRKAILALGFLLLAAGAAQAQLVVTPQAITHKDKVFDIDVRYPHTGNGAVDAVLAGFAKQMAGYAEPNSPPSEDNAGSVAMDYKVLRNDGQMFTVAMTGSVNYGGAHPLGNNRFFSFLMPNGAQVLLPELVDGSRGMKKVSRLVIADILRQFDKAGLPRTPERVRDVEWHARPEFLEGISFEWQPQELVMVYGPYEFGGNQGGPVVHIPMTVLVDVVRADPRAPSPSFDCRRARSAIEKTLCKDVELARLDRRLTSSYAMAVNRRHDDMARADKPAPSDRDRKNFAEKEVALDALVTSQRSWQARRDRDCADGALACLIASYTERLKAREL